VSHNNHTTDRTIRELMTDGCTLDLLREMADGWKDPFPEPVVETVELTNTVADQLTKGVNKRKVKVVRDDLPEIGSKGRFGSLLFQRMRQDTIVYIAPRVGWAAISLAKLGKMYNKRVILFAPACRLPSKHQQVAMELGADMRFYRVAAMPNLAKEAQTFAEKHQYMYAPLGLRHPLVTAAIVATAEKLAAKHGVPKQVWCAMSTGVLSRGLQIAWPKAEHHGVAVARNIQRGERGNAIIHSHPYNFTQDEMPALRPPFPSATNYDAKVWRFMAAEARAGAWMWNVAGEIEPTKPLPAKWSKSDVPYGDRSAFRRK
jgi:hypothetical protein